MIISIKRISSCLVYLTLSLIFNTIEAQEQPQDTLKVNISVLDESTDSPLPGVNVAVTGFSSGITDDNGNVSLNVPDYNSSIQVSGKGLQSKEVALKGCNTVTVKLFDDTYISVYDMVQLPTTQRPYNQTAGAVSSVKIGEAWRNPSESSPETYLQGKIPGLDVRRRSGMPGIGSNMYLRGISSLQCTNQPLIVVDGMPYDIKNYGKSIINNYFANPLNYIDINDVDNITVIKDATASIYGAKAANGVILINTRHTDDLTTKIDFIASAGQNMTPDQIPVMGAYDYRNYLTEIITPMLRSQGASDDDIRSIPIWNDDITSIDYYRYHNNTDWQSQIFEKSYNQNYYLRVTGGDPVGKYALSVGYLQNGGVLKNSQSARFGVRFNADLKMTKKFNVYSNFSLAYITSQLFDDGLQPRTNPIYLSLVKAPFLNPNVISTEGTISPKLEDTDIMSIGNPLAVIEGMKATNKNYRFFGSIKANYQISDNVTLSTLLGIPFDKIRESIFVPQNGVLADTSQSGIEYNRMEQRADRLYSIFSDSRINYKKSFENKHNLEASLGLRYNFNQTEGIEGIQFNSASDDYKNLGTGSSATGMRKSDGYLGDSKVLSFYSAIDYQFLSKYFLLFNISLDGSSRFGTEAEGLSMFSKKFGVFPSIGAAWLVSSENFMADVNTFDLLKLRASYGLTGNDDIGDYSTQQYYSSQYYLGYYGMPLGTIANDQLQWETVQKTNVGLDVAFFNERLWLSADYFDNLTKNMLVYDYTPSYSGFNYMLRNSGKLKSKGYEVGINGRILNGKLKWDVGVNLAHYENKIEELPTGEDLTDVAGAIILTRTGETVGVFYGYKTNGVYVTDNEASGMYNELSNGEQAPFTGGDIRFIDLDGNNVINSADRQIIGDPNPDFTGMISNKIQWRHLALEALVTFSQGNDIYNYQRYQLESMKGFENQSQAVLNRWKYQGQVTDIPKATWGDPMGNSRFSDRWIEDGSYIRLKTITLSYNVPFKPGFFKNLTVYLTGCNLITLTRYMGFDPEFSMGENYIYQGIDAGLTPVSKAVFFGFKLGL